MGEIGVANKSGRGHRGYIILQVLYCLGKYVKNYRKRFQDALAQASSTAEESIANIRTVRSFSNDPKMMKLYDKDINISYDMGKRLAALTGLVTCSVTLLKEIIHTISFLHIFL